MEGNLSHIVSVPVIVTLSHPVDSRRGLVFVKLTVKGAPAPWSGATVAPGLGLLGTEP